MAAELASPGTTIVMLERGRTRAEPDANRLVSTGIPVGDPWDIRRFGRGGAGAIWSGISPRLTPHDVKVRDWVPHSGWPFAYDTLVPYYRRAEAFLGVRTRGRAASPIQRAGLDITKVPLSPRRFGGRLNGLVEGAYVSRLEAHSQRSRVAGAEVIREDGSVTRVAADVFVVAAGGIETPSLLLRSGIGGPLVGRFFSDHLYVSVPILGRSVSVPPVPGPSDGATGPLVALSDDVRVGDRLSGAAGILKRGRFDPATPSLQAWKRLRRYQSMGDPPPRPVATVIGAATEAPRRVASRLRSLANSDFHFRVGLEAFPDPDSRVTLGDGVDRRGLPVSRVHLRVGPEVDRALDAFAYRAGELVEGWGGRVDRPEAGWRSAAWPGAHHMGATRMHHDPAAGVVNADARLHGVDNVFVAGASVFPTYGWANPTLTAVALAIRLADHLKAWSQ